MGISGLLPFVKNACRPVNIKDFSGATVAVDAYSWLHKGAFSCAEKLVKGEPTEGYVHYCLKMLNLMLDAGVKPIMVFDGCNLPSKAVTEKKRRENREKTKQRGKELLCQGKLREARELFQRCVDVTPEMAYEVIQACKKKNIDCIVAPYEADAQLAYLNKAGIAQIIITEDSDLTLFECEKILFKMDSGGGGLLYEKALLPKCFSGNAEKFSFEKFRYMCILSGCDYLPSLPGIGLAKACKFFTLTCNVDLRSVLSKLPSYLRMPRLVVPEEYKEAFIQANNTFLYQLVFCPKEKKLVPLNPYPSGVVSSDMEYAGKYLPTDVALQLALGNINVKTMKKFENSKELQSSKKPNSKNGSIWNSDCITDIQKSEDTKVKNTSFKFRTLPKVKPESLHKNSVERTEESKAREVPFRDDKLLSMYLSPPNKKPKITSDLDSPSLAEKDDENDDAAKEKSKPIRYTPFKKPLALNTTNVNKASSDASPEVVVKSRFFHKSEPIKSSKKETPGKGSWLESIDKEYALDCAKPLLIYPGRTIDILSKQQSSPKKDENNKQNVSLNSTSVKIGKENATFNLNKFRSGGFKWSSSPKMFLNENNSYSAECLFESSIDSDDNQSSAVSTSCSVDSVSPDSNYFSSSTCDSPVDVCNYDEQPDGLLVAENLPLKNIQDSEKHVDKIQDKLQGFWKIPKEVPLAPKSSNKLSTTRKIGRVGLSKTFGAKSAKKKCNTSEKNLNIKETLLNFRFVRFVPTGGPFIRTELGNGGRCNPQLQQNTWAGSNFTYYDIKVITMEELFL